MQEQNVLPIDVKALEHDAEAGPVRPLPSEQQEQLADDIFSREQGELVSAVLALQTGLTLAGHLAVDALQSHQERRDEDERRRRLPRRLPQD